MIDTTEIGTQIHEKWIIFLTSLAIGLTLLNFIRLKGFFKSFDVSWSPFIKGKEVLRAFIYFILFEAFLVPFIAYLFFDLKEFDDLPNSTKTWFALLEVASGFVGVYLSYFQMNAAQRFLLWKQTGTSWIKQIGVGIGAWFISYPFVIALSQLISIIVLKFSQETVAEQEAVQQVKLSFGHPLLTLIMIFAVSILVPMTEELLFRGLLQSWLKNRLKSVGIAILISSLIFTAFHYSSTQGLYNIELLLSLFSLSCVLGFIYERQHSLWAPIGLHSFFNFFSSLMIFMQS